MKKLILLALVITAFDVRAGNDTGGANGVGDQLFDFYENEGTSPFSVKDSKAYKEILVPLFNELDKKMPSLSSSLMAGLKKPWLLETKPLNNSKCVNSSLIQTAKIVVACQNFLEIRVNKKWYFKASIKNQAGLILHELIRERNFCRAEDSKMSDEEINYLTRTLMNSSNLTDLELQAQLAKTSMSIFATASDIKNTNTKSIVRKLYLNYCQKPSSNKAYRFITSLFHLARDSRKNHGEQAALYDYGKELAHVYAAQTNYEKSGHAVCAAAKLKLER